ncbi:MAG: SPFH domain-containing protein, partial [Kiritimatiellia bacterium]
QKGTWRRVLGPGTYRMNPYGYRIDTLPAVSIPIGYAGVITSLSGEQAREGAFATPGQKGVREDILQPGLYFLNPREYKVDVLEIGVSQVSMLKEGGRVFTKAQLDVQNVALQELNYNMLEQQQEKRADYLQKSSGLLSSLSESRPSRKVKEGGKYNPKTATQQDQQDFQRVPEKYRLGDDMASLGLAQVLEFPSRDGFQISLDMTVEFELHPENIAWIFRTYGDLPAVLDKIIVPQISSVARNKGSEYGARDFVAGDARSVFQDELTSALKTTLEEKKIIIHNALIRQVSVPMQILEPIQQVGLAIEQDLTNLERQNTAKKLAELNTEQTLIDQRKQQVAEETKKIRAEIKADQERQVANIQADTQRQVAEIRKQTAKMEADRVRLLGTAKAEAYQRVEGEKADGLRLKARAMGDPEAYTLWEFATRLSKDLRLNILHAGDGTLWTDLEKAGGAANLGGAEILGK